MNMRLSRPHQGDESGQDPDRSRRGCAIEGQQCYRVNRWARAADSAFLRGSWQWGESRDLASRRHRRTQRQGARSALFARHLLSPATTFLF